MANPLPRDTSVDGGFGGRSQAEPGSRLDPPLQIMEARSLHRRSGRPLAAPSSLRVLARQNRRLSDSTVLLSLFPRPRTVAVVLWVGRLRNLTLLVPFRLWRRSENLEHDGRRKAPLRIVQSACGKYCTAHLHSVIQRRARGPRHSIQVLARVHVTRYRDCCLSPNGVASVKGLKLNIDVRRSAHTYRT